MDKDKVGIKITKSSIGLKPEEFKAKEVEGKDLALELEYDGGIVTVELTGADEEYLYGNVIGARPLHNK